jgi:hypothetical protein
MGLKVTNNAFGTLNASINSSATTIVLVAGQGARFPTLSAGDYFYATLIDTSNNLEIVKCTARSTDTLTVVRGQDSTTARAYATNDRFELRPTAVMFTELITKAEGALPAAGGTATGAITIINPDTSGSAYGFAARISSDAQQKFQYRSLGNNGTMEGSIGLSSNSVSDADFLLFGHGSGSTRIGRGNDTHIQIDASGRVLTPIQPFVFASYAGAALARGTKIPVTTGQTRGSGWNNSTYRYTCPVAGVYQCSLNITGNTTQPSACQPAIYINGAIVAYSYYPGGAVAIARYCGAGDYIEFYYNHDSGGYNGASTAQASVVLLG